MARGCRGHRQHRGGRILPHTRDTDDVTATVTREGLRPEHAAAISATTDQGISENVRRDHRSRLQRMSTMLLTGNKDFDRTLQDTINNYTIPHPLFQ